MHSKINFKLLLTALFLLYSGAGFSQSKNFFTLKNEPVWLQKITTTDKKPSSRNIQDGYYLFLYEQQNNIETQEQYQHNIREIVSDNGVQNGSEISVTYDPSYQKLTFHKIIIWRNHRPIDKLNAHDFKVIQNEKELSKFIYSGTYDAYLILDDVRKGDKIEYSFTLKGENPVFAGKYSNSYYFDGESQISNIYINLIAKKDRTLQFKNFNSVPVLKTKEQNGLKIYEWQSQLTKTIKNFDFEPSWYSSYSRVQVSEFSSWGEIVDWALQLNTYDVKKSLTLNRKIQELKAKSKGNGESYLELATRFVQDEVRYMGIEMGEYSHRPNSPEKVLKQRYGDCKDKSLLLIALLKGNGINAFPVYINTYLNDKIKDILPTTGAFDHAIVLAEFAGQKIWIDPTMSDQGGSILRNYFPYAANVLVVKPGNSRLERVEPSKTGKLSSIALIKMPDTAEGKKAEIVIKSTYTLNYADYLRGIISSSGIDKLEKDYLEYYAKLYPGVAKTKDIIINDDKRRNIISMEENYDIENSWEKDDSVSNSSYAYFYGDMISNELRTLNKARNVPFALKYPSNISQVIKILIPTKVDIEPEETHIDRNGYRFNYQLFYHADTLILAYNYENKLSEIPALETQQYVKDKEVIRDAINFSLTWGGTIKSDVSNDLNISMLLLCLFTFIAAGIAAFFIYRQQTSYNLEEIKNAREIGGWLILVAIALVITPFSLCYTMYKSGAFNTQTWDNLGTYGNTEVLWKWFLSLETVFNTLLIVFHLLIAFLFFNRRKQLPRYYIIYRLFGLTIIILDTVVAYLLDHNIYNTMDWIQNISTVFWSLLFSTIWITYFFKSKRVKETFVFTYPESEWKSAYFQEISTQINVPHPSDDVKIEIESSTNWPRTDHTES